MIHTKYTCDLEVFYPEKKKEPGGKLVVGWTGSLTNNENEKIRYRGVDDIIKPACDAVEGVEFRPHFAEQEWITDDNRMRQYYNSLDLYICASKSESGPRPVLEAAACGVPSLTTDVGIVPELIQNNINGMIVDRTIDAFIKELRYCVKNRDALHQMGDRARETMELEFNWKKLIRLWIDFFQCSLELSQLKRDDLI